jgi:hypothetical protein
MGIPLRRMLYSCLVWVLLDENEGCIGQKKESSSVLTRCEDLSMRSFDLTDPARRWSCRNWQRWRYGQKPVATCVLHGRRYTCVLPLPFLFLDPLEIPFTRIILLHTLRSRTNTQQKKYRCPCRFDLFVFKL